MAFPNAPPFLGVAVAFDNAFRRDVGHFYSLNKDFWREVLFESPNRPLAEVAMVPLRPRRSRLSSRRFFFFLRRIGQWRQWWRRWRGFRGAKKSTHD